MRFVYTAKEQMEMLRGLCELRDTTIDSQLPQELKTLMIDRVVSVSVTKDNKEISVNYTILDDNTIEITLPNRRQ